MNFSDVIKENATKKYTENGAKAYNTTGDCLLDLFSIAGALRTRSEEDIVSKFSLAFSEDNLLATKLLFYMGNIRGGLGERRTFRICLKWLAENHPTIISKNISLIAAFNRWDSIFELLDTPAETVMWTYLIETLMTDMSNYTTAMRTGTTPHLTLLAKWLPSENASSKKTRKLARRIIEKLNISPKQYRQMLSALRAGLRVVEKSMSANEWDKITYSNVPSYAMKNYRRAFERHDGERFTDFIESVKRGEEKINSSTLFPYDIIHQYTNNSRYSWNISVKKYDEILEQQWKALPNYVNDGSNVLVMADVSGSMEGRPMETSIGLAIYFAQHNTGLYHNTFMTFSSVPSYFYLDDEASLKDCINKVANSPWDMTTNLTGAMKTILEDAKENKISSEDMPKALVVISDMEIDSAERYGRNTKWDYADTLADMFEEYGYKMPKLVFWNVQSRNDTFLTKGKNTVLVSGQSPSTFRSVLKTIDMTAYEAMLEVLNDPMYDCVQI